MGFFRRRYPPYPIRSALPIIRRKNPMEYRIKHQFGVEDEAFLQTMQALTGAPLHEGNGVEILANGVGSFPAMLAGIRAAKRTITMETYIYWDGAIARVFAEALAERCRAGIDVKLILDAVGSARMSRSLIDFLVKNGVEVLWYHPLRWYTLSRINHRTHRKLLIVDGTVGFAGGFGIADEWSGDADAPDHWRETNVRIEGPAVTQMQFAFMDNWIKAGGLVPTGLDWFPKVGAGGDVPVQVIKSSPAEGVSTVKLFYGLALTSAKQRVSISNAYFIPDADAVRALEGAARRGVEVRVIVPGRWSDVPIVRQASRMHYDRLLRRGVRVFEYQPTMMHAKTMVVDGLWTTVGSSNFDARSFRLNDEVNVGIYDRTVAAQMEAMFEHDLARSVEIRLGAWRRRSWFARAKESAADFLRPQL